MSEKLTFEGGLNKTAPELIANNQLQLVGDMIPNGNGLKLRDGEKLAGTLMKSSRQMWFWNSPRAIWLPDGIFGNVLVEPKTLIVLTRLENNTVLVIDPDSVDSTSGEFDKYLVVIGLSPYGTALDLLSFTPTNNGFSISSASITAKTVYINEDNGLIAGSMVKPESPINSINILTEPTVAYNTTSGTGLYYGSIVGYCYTLMDKFGGETAPSAVKYNTYWNFLREVTDVTDESEYYNKIVLSNLTDDNIDTDTSVLAGDVEFINIYRSDGKYTQSIEGMTPFYKIATISSNTIAFDDNVPSPITPKLITTDNNNAGVRSDVIASTGGKVFTGNSEPTQFGQYGCNEFLEIKVTNNNSRNYVSRTVVFKITNGDLVDMNFSVPVFATTTNYRIFTSDRRTACRGYYEIIDSANAYITVVIPYIQASTITTLYLGVSHTPNGLVPLTSGDSDFNTGEFHEIGTSTDLGDDDFLPTYRLIDDKDLVLVSDRHETPLITAYDRFENRVSSEYEIDNIDYLDAGSDYYFTGISDFGYQITKNINRISTTGGGVNPEYRISSIKNGILSGEIGDKAGYSCYGTYIIKEIGERIESGNVNVLIGYFPTGNLYGGINVFALDGDPDATSDHLYIGDDDGSTITTINLYNYGTDSSDCHVISILQSVYYDGDTDLFRVIVHVLDNIDGTLESYDGTVTSGSFPNVDAQSDIRMCLTANFVNETTFADVGFRNGVELMDAGDDAIASFLEYGNFYVESFIGFNGTSNDNIEFDDVITTSDPSISVLRWTDTGGLVFPPSNELPQTGNLMAMVGDSGKKDSYQNTLYLYYKNTMGILTVSEAGEVSESTIPFNANVSPMNQKAVKIVDGVSYILSSKGCMRVVGQDVDNLTQRLGLTFNDYNGYVLFVTEYGMVYYMGGATEHGDLPYYALEINTGRVYDGLLEKQSAYAEILDMSDGAVLADGSFGLLESVPTAGSSSMTYIYIAPSITTTHVSGEPIRTKRIRFINPVSLKEVRVNGTGAAVFPNGFTVKTTFNYNHGANKVVSKSNRYEYKFPVGSRADWCEIEVEGFTDISSIELLYNNIN